MKTEFIDFLIYGFFIIFCIFSGVLLVGIIDPSSCGSGNCLESNFFIFGFGGIFMFSFLMIMFLLLLDNLIRGDSK